MLPFDPLFRVALIQVPGPPDCIVRLRFNVGMAPGHLPQADAFELHRDYETVVSTNVAWTAPRSLSVTFPGGPPTFRGIIELPVEDPGLMQNTGRVCQAPQFYRFV